MMKTIIMRLCLALTLFFAGFASADAAGITYSAQDLHTDCRHAEAFLMAEKKQDLLDSLAGARCLSYLQGFVAGYWVSEVLARRVGVDFAAFCLPPDVDMLRLVRAVLLYLSLHPLPPETVAAVPAEQLTIAALARTFACALPDE
ncbi:MAG: hypothetical protein FWG81_03685 [Betaproteobacteria bacterium]|nr:hypothetical protein [Betaproteobacteria bacterium]